MTPVYPKHIVTVDLPAELRHYALGPIYSVCLTQRVCYSIPHHLSFVYSVSLFYKATETSYFGIVLLALVWKPRMNI